MDEMKDEKRDGSSEKGNQGEKHDQAGSLVRLLATINRLQVKAFNAPNRESLTFIILNDTYPVFKYDRSFLWDMERKSPKLLGISGQFKVYKETELAQKWTRLLLHLKEPHKPQQLSQESFPAEAALWKELVPSKDTIVYWLPIKSSEKLRLGFCLEIWQAQPQLRNPKEELAFLENSLMPAYGSAWSRFDKRHFFGPLIRNRQFWYFGIIALLVVLFAVRVPLRVAASCEVVPADPVLVTAPLNGIIHQLLVKPGQEVYKGQTLFEYDKRIPLEELKVAEKQVQIALAEVNRASTVGLNDPKALEELQILKLKLQKDEIAVQLARSQAKKLEAKASASGIIMVNDPDEWQGKPVKIGEKVLTINNPQQTKIKFWLPEDDNILIDKSKPLNIILNIAPDREFAAKLDYISFESSIGGNMVPSFMGEANWEGQPPKDIKLGLRGTAVLYGNRVSLFYFIIRKPWSTFRRITEI